MLTTDKTFKDDVESFSGVVLVDFFAEWCGPCKMLSPIIEELTKDYEKDDTVKVLKVNIDENAETAKKYNVVSIPTLIIFKSGVKVKELVGVQSKEALAEAIAEASK